MMLDAACNRELLDRPDCHPWVPDLEGEFL
jgi:hypothetical protein